MWSVHTMEYYSAIERNEVLTQATTRMDPENVMLNERSLSPKDRYRPIPFMKYPEEANP